MFSQVRLNKSRISPLQLNTNAPDLFLLIIIRQPTKQDPDLILLFHAVYTRRTPAWNTLFLKLGNGEPNEGHNRTKMARPSQIRPRDDRLSARSPTTSVLTATTLVYATGAGITAAAGTRLALQLILREIFIFPSFRLTKRNPRHRYFLSLPHRVGIGEFARLLPSLDGCRFSGALSGIKPNSPLPALATEGQYPSVES